MVAVLVEYIRSLNQHNISIQVSSSIVICPPYSWLIGRPLYRPMIDPEFIIHVLHNTWSRLSGDRLVTVK